MITIHNMKPLHLLQFVFILTIIFFFNSCLVTEDDVIKDEFPTIAHISEELKISEAHDTHLSIPADFDFEGTIATWFGFSNAAASVTFDDGTYDQYAVAFPLLEEMGIKGTFYLATSLIDQGYWNDKGVTRKMMSWIQASRIAAAGHEIGSHSMSHIDLTIEGIDLQMELKGSRDYIEKQLPDVKVQSFCWPHWRETANAVQTASDYYISGRSGNGIIEYYLTRKGGIPSDPPGNMYTVNALGFLNSHKERDWKAVIDSTYDRGSWFVSSYHGLDDGILAESSMGWKPLNIELFVRTIQYPIDKDFWIDTFINVSKYIFERDNALLHIINKSDRIEVILDDQLDDAIYNQKVSLSLKIPEFWSSIVVIDQSGKEIPYLLDENSLFIDILPDGRIIQIKPY